MKKFLSVLLTLAMLLTFGAIAAFAANDCGCECTVCDDACDGTECDAPCDCDCCADPDPDPETPPTLSGYELWKLKLTTGELGAFLQSLGQKLLGWGDWILKVLYYVCFGWLLSIDITITPR